MVSVANHTAPGKAAHDAEHRPRELFPQGGHTAQPVTPDGLARDILTTAQLTALFSPLARDYRAAILTSGGLGFRDRSRVLRRRLTAYDQGLRAALDQAKGELTQALRGPRAWGGR